MIAHFLPSPPINGFTLGPLHIRFYALCILTGIIGAWWLTSKRWEARGGKKEQLETVLFVAVFSGIIGARLYHVVTDHQLYFGSGRHPLDAVKIWNGGLGIWGGIAGGALGAWLASRRYQIRFSALADIIAPTLPLAQAVGRLGNWFNQELFGRPLDKPWALSIDPLNRPRGYEDYATFTPTFLYEIGFLLIIAVILFTVERRFVWGRGKVVWLYVFGYTVGRAWVESLRIDTARHIGRFRLNEYTSWILMAIAGAFLCYLWATKPGRLSVYRSAPTDDVEVVTPLTTD
ncbi:MAG: prolipoprotein diacylglyceryl transferase [Propionibacteriaceae bacterium]